MSGRASEALVGAVLNGKYRLVELLGEGGMGAVFGAEPVGGGPRVAVKILHPEHIGDEPVLRRFFAEAQAAERLVHPNIVRVHGFAAAEDGSPYLVMDRLSGVPLSAYTRARTAFPVSKAAPIVHGVLQALAHAHEHGVVHRDLKPDNVFLAREAGGTYAVKLLDFGIAKVMDVAGGVGGRTRTGMMLGTPGYMSPEQVRDGKRVDPRSDLWSVGVMLYELLTGADAFPAPTELAKLTAVLTSEPRPIGAVAPALASWEPFFARALASDPEARFANAHEMAAALLAQARGGVAPVASAEFLAIRPSVVALPPTRMDALGPTDRPPAAPTDATPPTRVDPAPALADGPPIALAAVADARGARRGVPIVVAVVVALVALLAGFAAGVLAAPHLPALDDDAPSGAHKPPARKTP